MSVPSKKIQRKKKTPLRDDKVQLFKQCETFWGWDCTFGREQEGWSGGRGQRITLKNDFSCIWQVGMSCRRRKAILQYQKGMLPTVLIACRRATCSDIAQLLGTETRGALLESRAPLHVQEPQTIFFVSVLRGWRHKACGATSGLPRRTPFPARGQLRWRSWDSRSAACLCLHERG